MRCPKCGVAVPVRDMIFSDAFRGFACAGCGAALQATYVSRLAAIVAGIVVGLGTASALRYAGLATWAVVLGGSAGLLGAYALACRTWARVRVVK